MLAWNAGSGFPPGMMMPGAVGMQGPAGIPEALAGPMFGGLQGRPSEGNGFAHPTAPDLGDLPAGINVEEARCSYEILHLSVGRPKLQPFMLLRSQHGTCSGLVSLKV